MNNPPDTLNPRGLLPEEPPGEVFGKSSIDIGYEVSKTRVQSGGIIHGFRTAMS